MSSGILNCRFYRAKFPAPDELVMVTIKQIEDMGAYVQLLEYNNIEGMILMGELSRRRIRSINKLIRVGRNEAVVVVRVDPVKGYIDCSKRRASPEDRDLCHSKHAKGNKINLILRNVAQKLQYKEDNQLEELYSKSAWYFDEKFKQDNASFEWFKKAVADSSVLDECPLDNNVREVLLAEIQRRLAPNPVKIRADVEVSCFNFEGIDAIKRALKRGIACSTEEMQISVNLIAPPTYVLTVTTLDHTDGLAAVNKAMGEIEESIEESGGSFKVVSEPKVVNRADDLEFAKQLEKLEQENQEVAGDDSNSEGEETDSTTGGGGGAKMANGKGDAAEEEEED
ncbi:eukaryotic translation initiation factor 2 subunit 1-like [Symsagittifera roscoffensis]|uniref:eukaryotic translation initiation factor 2 subunit 1-like n=1 Tax=Symsagittifera roscoffensis TaxID=84072 RepID=UPI00307BB4B7